MTTRAWTQIAEAANMKLIKEAIECAVGFWDHGHFVSAIAERRYEDAAKYADPLNLRHIGELIRFRSYLGEESIPCRGHVPRRPTARRVEFSTRGF